MAGTNLLARLLTLPFTLLSLIFTRVLRIRGVPYLRLSWPGSNSNGNGAANGDGDADVIVDPTAASKYFVRMLRSHASEPSAIDESSWFTQGGYNSALRKAKEDNLILCVVLTCKDHDDNAAFLRQTLCTHAFKSLMQDHRNSILLWGGEVTNSRDAHVTSTILQAATYPFISFISLQPIPSSRLTGSASVSSAKMAVFSRLEGLQATSVPHLSAHISDTLLPRLSSFLDRLKGQKREREAERILRQEQDRAYAEAGKRDRERVQAKEAELRAKRDAEEAAKQAQIAKARESTNRAAWRKQTAASFVSEPATGLRFAIRLPDGRRLMRKFGEEELARRLWAYVECEAHGCPVGTGSASATRPDPGYEPVLAFSLASTFPRRTYRLQEIGHKTLGGLIAEGLLDKQGASLVVEGLTLPGKSGAVHDEDEEEEEEED